MALDSSTPQPPTPEDGPIPTLSEVVLAVVTAVSVLVRFYSAWKSSRPKKAPPTPVTPISKHVGPKEKK